MGRSSQVLPYRSDIRNRLTDLLARGVIFEEDGIPGSLFYVSEQDGVEYPLGGAGAGLSAAQVNALIEAAENYRKGLFVTGTDPTGVAPSAAQFPSPNGGDIYDAVFRTGTTPDRVETWRHDGASWSLAGVELVGTVTSVPRTYFVSNTTDTGTPPTIAGTIADNSVARVEKTGGNDIGSIDWFLRVAGAWVLQDTEPASVNTDEKTYAITRLSTDPLISTLNSTQLFALVTSFPQYATVPVLNDGDNIVVVQTDDNVERNYEVSGGVAVAVTTQAASAPVAKTYPFSRAANGGVPTFAEIQAWQNPNNANATDYAGEAFPTVVGTLAIIDEPQGRSTYRMSNLAPETWTLQTGPRAGERTFTIERTAADPTLDTLTAANLLAAVNASPAYTITSLAEGDNIEVMVDDVETNFEVQANGTAQLASTQSKDDPPTVISFPTHGYPQTAVEGEVAPLPLHIDAGGTPRVPTTFAEVNHFVVTVTSPNDVGVRTVAEMDGREYSNWQTPLAGSNPSEAIYLDIDGTQGGAGPNRLTNTKTDIRLIQRHASDAGRYKFFIDDLSPGLTSPNATNANQTYGDGVLTTFTITHNLNSLNYIPTFEDATTGERLFPQITTKGANAITFQHPSAPATNAYRFLALKVD